MQSNGSLDAVTAPEEGLWDARDVAAYLKCSTSFVYKAAEDGRLPCVRIGSMLRFVPDIVRAFARGESRGRTVIPLPRGLR